MIDWLEVKYKLIKSEVDIFIWFYTRSFDYMEGYNKFYIFMNIPRTYYIYRNLK